MYRSGPLAESKRRNGVILLVVLILLTLFALVGITFVLYADAEATAARIAREATSVPSPDVDPRFLLACFLNQLIYDVDDNGGVYSALRGHSLARLMYGNDDEALNESAFNGTGRLHTGPGTYMNPFAIDDYPLVNYTYFPGDGFLRDPERLGQRTSVTQPRGPFTGGFNAPYTYPDLNNMFLAAVRADGTVLAPSFHRPWTGFGPLDPSNPNWYDASKPWLKYQVLRPRPAEMGPGFPLPQPGGDVKNLVAAPGGNDSIWLDLDFPVQTTPDGRKYKPLFAPLVVDLDNRVNVNVHGNVRGPGRTHVSNQGVGPWEVNLGRVLTKANNEWSNLFVGPPASVGVGCYGRDRQPGQAATSAPAGPLPHVYGQMDSDACQETAGFALTSPYFLPSALIQPWSISPSYPQGYGNGSAAERLNHPRQFNASHPAGDDRAFALFNMEALLRPNDAGSSALSSDLVGLCPTNFADPRIRRLVTTHSFDLDVPGVSPWLFDRASSGYQVPLGGADQPPIGPPIPFPDLPLRTTTPIPTDSDFQVPGATPTDPRVDWRSWAGALGRVDLHRFLPPYPHQGQGLDRASWSPIPLMAVGGRFDTGPVAVATQFGAAQTARQQLANDIYRRLLVVTSVSAPTNPVRPSNADLAPRRWLAQLAVNIVDFLDEDEISTPFQFYTSQDAGGLPLNAGALSAGNLELPRYWVFGTELPRIVLNEVLAEYQLPAQSAPGLVTIKVCAELFNPLPAGPLSSSIQPLDALPIPLYVAGAGAVPGYAPYQLVLADTNTNPGGPLLSQSSGNSNVLGTPDVVQAVTTPVDFSTLVRTVGDPTTPVPALLAPQGFFLLGPPDSDARGTIAPPLVPAATPLLRSLDLTFPVRYTPPNSLAPDYRQTGITVLLRRLINPYLPPDPRPAIAGVLNPLYNPYSTIDYLSRIPLNNATLPGVVYSSWGKRQPYAADPSQVAAQMPVVPLATLQTFGRQNIPIPVSGHYDWLVHLDRPLLSPVELLQVSGYSPHQLTQRFMSTNLLTGAITAFGQRVPWFDESNRLYRIFEYLRAGQQSLGSPPIDRVAGKVNINTIWDPETLLALCDPQPGNHFADANVYNAADPQDASTIYGRLLALRTPGGAPGPNDRPFLSLAAGHSPSPGDGNYPPGGDPLFPKGSGINDTLLRAVVPDGGADSPRLFEVPGDHPYLRSELLTKLFNNLTTRSNVFAVWVTVGFFEVVDDTTRPIKLGSEIDRDESRQRRHRMFAVVDRTSLKLFEVPSTTEVILPPGSASVLASVTPGSMAGTTNTGRPWSIRAGSLLTVDSGNNQETVRVTAITPTSFTAVFTRSHASGFRIVGRGNPGPGVRYNPTWDPEVVPYCSIID
ncbi:MAG TPA: hypothetical protein VH592_18015 [Gemmataceae bacterium]|jgi:hypothetical protein